MSREVVETERKRDRLTDGRADAYREEQSNENRTVSLHVRREGNAGAAEKVLSNAVVPPSGQRNAIIFVGSVAVRVRRVETTYLTARRDDDDSAVGNPKGESLRSVCLSPARSRTIGIRPAKFHVRLSYFPKQVSVQTRLVH